MYITKMYIKKETYQRMIRNTIKKIMEEKKVSEDTACWVLYQSDMFRQFRFIFI